MSAFIKRVDKHVDWRRAAVSDLFRAVLRARRMGLHATDERRRRHTEVLDAVVRIGGLVLVLHAFR